MPKQERETPLNIKIEQMLTEARVVIPGAQALLGFQLIATLTKAFQDLPGILQYIHAGGLCAVTLAATLLMTPAAVHRIAFDGEDNTAFFRIGSALVIMAVAPLAIGIAANIAVVFYKVTDSIGWALGVAVAALVFLLSVWFLYPAWLRNAHNASPVGASRQQSGGDLHARRP
jgi:hypothetical protein